MPNSPDFIAHVLELMRPAAAASARAMFGGHGIYADGIIVAIVIDDTVYFKTDDLNRGEFTALGLSPFRYAMKSGELQAMSYHRAPDEAIESPDAMAHWVRSAMGAALRSAHSKRPQRASKPKKSAKALPAAGRKARR